MFTLHPSMSVGLSHPFPRVFIRGIPSPCYPTNLSYFDNPPSSWMPSLLSFLVPGCPYLPSSLQSDHMTGIIEFQFFYFVFIIHNFSFPSNVQATYFLSTFSSYYGSLHSYLCSSESRQLSVSGGPRSVRHKLVLIEH